MQKRVYLDYASGVNNPGSLSKEGVTAKKELESARAILAQFFGARPKEIVFTSGGTEANNLAILGTVFAAKKTHKKIHMVTTNIEHASVLETCKHLEQTGQASVTYVPVESNGIVSPKKIKEAIQENTVLVSVQYANNEIGTIQPIKEVAKEIRHFRNHPGLRPPLLIQGGERSTYPLLHTDACQALQYLPMRADALGADLITVNGSKVNGVRGVGALYVKTSTPISPIMFGGDQEKGLRPGTENIDAISTFANAVSNIKIDTKKMTALRDFCIAEIKKIIPESMLNGDAEKRLPNNINITIPDKSGSISSELLVLGVDALGFAISEKSACKSGEEGMSHVIEAIRPNETNGALRITLGKNTTKKDMQHFVKALKTVYERQNLTGVL